MEGNQKKLHPLEHGVYNDTCYNDLQGGIRIGSWVDLVDKLWLFHGHFLTTISVKNEIRRPRADERWRGARAVIAMHCIIKLAVDLRRCGGYCVAAMSIAVWGAFLHSPDLSLNTA